MIRQLKKSIQQLGVANGLLYLLGRFLQRISHGRWHLIRYCIVAQPIPSPPVPGCRPSPGSSVERVMPDDPICAAFPRPKEVIAQRFANGHTCLVAKVKGQFAGFLWVAHNFYEEDEVRCRFELANPAAAVWDYDVHVEPAYRMGRTLARLWDTANEALEKEGKRWSFSRISAFNADSLAAHDHLGIWHLEILTFLCLGGMQLTLRAKWPFVHVCGPQGRHPVLKLTVTEHSQPPAVLVGLCAHGLGQARDLHRAGIAVHALETDKNLPGTRTNAATIHWVGDINGPGLIRSLKRLATQLSSRHKPVLFLTNDRMVRVIGEHAHEISQHYRLSWAHCAPTILNLLSKDHIEQRCLAVGLNYPKSMLLTQAATIEHDLAALKPPIILKPTQPLSLFKTLVLDSAAAIKNHQNLVEQCLPVLAQEFIPGDDRKIRFGALYLDHGKVLARFEGRKLLSRPMGHTVIGVSEPHDRIHELTVKFFAGLDVSGAVSLELKEAPDGSFWVIEPTVGRTDFWAGLCTANGVNLPVIEYAAQTGDKFPVTRQTTRTIWINTERYPRALLWLLRHEPSRLLRQRLRDVYFDVNDVKPAIAGRIRYLVNLSVRAARKIRNLLFHRTAGN
ncbi:MAG: hypothetical protein ACYCWC_13400 [Rhodocyclaceae bacterium]